jgi:subtilisin-like proprotein convertase family protein
MAILLLAILAVRFHSARPSAPKPTESIPGADARATAGRRTDPAGRLPLPTSTPASRTPAARTTPGMDTWTAAAAPPLALPGPSAPAPTGTTATTWLGRELDRANPPPVPTEYPVELTNEILLSLAPNADPKEVGRDLKVQPLRSLIDQPQFWVFRAGSVDAAQTARAVAAQDPRVLAAFPNRKLHLTKFYVPNDPYYPANYPSSSFHGQWHLTRANIENIWLQEVTGAGVVLAIEDDGLEFTHPDLAGNFDAADSLNFGGDQPSSSFGPNTSLDGTNNEDRHGTCVGGVAAAVGGNGIGVTGAAPMAQLAINRLDFSGSQTEAEFVSGLLYHDSGTNTSIKIKNHSYGFSIPFVDNALESSAASTSMASGTIHVYAAGNNFGTSGEDANKSQPQNSPDIICVAASGSDDLSAYYSNIGACVFITAPSSSGSGTFGVMTTDRVGSVGYDPIAQYADNTVTPHLTEFDDPLGTSGPADAKNYTSVFGGTSSAAPLVSGIMALGKQANPAMTLRMAQHALVRTAVVINAGDASVAGGGDGTTAGSAWKTNGAGYKFNQNFGFGLIHASNFVKEVVKYSGVNEAAPRVISASFTTTITDAVSVGGKVTLTPTTKTFVVPDTTPLESVELTMVLSHTHRGQLEIYLSSPAGTTSRLMLKESTDTAALPDPNWQNISNWTFCSHTFWGENPAGTWTISVIDNVPGTTGTWKGYTFTAHMGTPVLDTTPPTVTSITPIGTNPTNVGPLKFAVKFSEYVTGVDTSDFTLTTTGSIAGASVTGVSGGVDSYIVSVNPGTGAGTIALNLVDNDTIVDGAGNMLGGTGLGNGNLTSSTTFTYDSIAPSISVTSATADGTYIAGAAIDVTLNFSKSVSLVGGNLKITLDTGAILIIAPFAGQTSVSATYIVGVGDHSNDLTVQSPLALTGGTLQDIYGNNTVLTIAPASNLAAGHAIVVDAAPPTKGTVLDGLSGAEASTQSSTTTISAHWSGFGDVGTGIAGYRWAIGSSSGAADVLAFTDVGTATVASTSFFNITLSLTPGSKYFVTVEARDGAGQTITATSSGVQVLPASSTVVPLPPSQLSALCQPIKIQLQWTASPTAGVTTYRLWWKPSAAAWTAATLVDNIAGTTTTVTGLTLGNSYDFQLRSLLGANESESVFVTATTANAVAIGGTGYGSIGSALAAAHDGDTITIQAGNFTENLNVTHGVTLVGSGANFTTITAAAGGTDTISVNSASPVTISQITVTGGHNGVNAGLSAVTLRNVVIHHTGNDGVLSGASASLLQVLSCTIAHNGAKGINAGGTTTIRDVIATGNVGVGISAPAAASVTYSDSYANGSSAAFAGGFDQSTDYTTPATFTDEANNDYTEQPGSFSVDSGDPMDAFSLEPAYNGGRINLGAYGNTPFAATSPLPLTSGSGGGGGGGGGGGCGLTGLESAFLLLALRRRRRDR